MSTVFRAIADPTRREIPDTLARGEAGVSELAGAFSMTLPAVSQHLRVLQDAQLIIGRREGRLIFYRLNAAPLQDVARWVNPCQGFWETRLGALLGPTIGRGAARK